MTFTADKEFVQKQQKVLQLFVNLNQPNYNAEQAQVGQTYNPRDNVGDFTVSWMPKIMMLMFINYRMFLMLLMFIFLITEYPCCEGVYKSAKGRVFVSKSNFLTNKSSTASTNSADIWFLILCQRLQHILSSKMVF